MRHGDFDLDAFENVLHVALMCDEAEMTLTHRKGVPFGLSVFGRGAHSGPVFATCGVQPTIDADLFREFVLARLGEMGLSWDEVKRPVMIMFKIRVTDGFNSGEGTEVTVGSMDPAPAPAAASLVTAQTDNRPV